ncbi:MAG: hypothetical protein C4K58_04180 [Flavobacteriaceae bacterium]|nr:MAG: hypothetical protein C4K58_04180 [Flavobacteriaceae bacterium]
MVPALGQMVNQLEKTVPIAFFFECNAQVERLKKTVEIAIYRTIQEALNNICKYSDAKKVEIRVEASTFDYHFYVVDNGKGFDLEKDYAQNLGGNGLQNMQNRTRLFGGEFYINSNQNSGTSIHVVVPKENNLEDS